MISRLADLWHGRLPLATAFWNYMIFWGLLINVAGTVGVLAVLAAAGGDSSQGWPAWAALVLHLLPMPFTVLCLVGVWRSGGRPEVTPARRGAVRLVAIIWAVALLAT